MRIAVSLLAAALAVPSSNAADTDTIESTVKAVYEVISGPPGPRNWERFRALFADGARLVAMRTTAEGTTPAVMTPDDYVKRTTPNFEKNGFYEAPVSQRMETFGSIAHVFSTYESRRAPGDKPFARGINSIQLVRSGNGWKVMTILWDSEREGVPIPEKYLRDPAR